MELYFFQENYRELIRKRPEFELTSSSPFLYNDDRYAKETSRLTDTTCLRYLNCIYEGRDEKIKKALIFDQHSPLDVQPTYSNKFSICRISFNVI